MSELAKLNVLLKDTCIKHTGQSGDQNCDYFYERVAESNIRSL